MTSATFTSRCGSVAWNQSTAAIPASSHSGIVICTERKFADTIATTSDAWVAATIRSPSRSSSSLKRTRARASSRHDPKISARNAISVGTPPSASTSR